MRRGLFFTGVLLIFSLIFSACGSSSSGGSGGTIVHNGSTYGTVTSPYTGRVWLDRNLGAFRVCTRLDDTSCYGDYYQWGRNYDGHENDSSETNSTLALDINSAGDKFITTSVTPDDWADSDVDN